MSQSVTFDVTPELKPGELLAEIAFPERFASSLLSPIEAMSPMTARMVEVADDHALLSASKHAFYGHFPLRLSPDVIWLTLTRNFALHVLDHAEELRGRFVTHQGKEKLSVERPDFLPGEDNPWEEVFAAFSDLVAKRVGKLRQWIKCDFSTTGSVERAVSDLMVMETFEPYFEYEMFAGCGIPRITLLGTAADWKSVRQRAALFGEFGLEAWCQALEPILAQFEAAASGNVDQAFWQSMFRYHSGSGPAVLTGWLTCLFPYLQDDKKQRYPNPALADWQARLELDRQQYFTESWRNPQGVGLDAYPSCLTNVPLSVHWGATRCLMRIVGGLIGVSQDATDGTVQPEVGWALTHGPDRSEWKCTTKRTIWPMMYNLPKRNEFLTVKNDAGQFIAQANMPTTLLGNCQLFLRCDKPENSDLPYSILQSYFLNELGEVASWRTKVAAAVRSQAGTEIPPELRLEEQLIEPSITATWGKGDRKRILLLEFALTWPDGSARKLKLAINNTHDLSSVVVESVAESSG